METMFKFSTFGFFICFLNVFFSCGNSTGNKNKGEKTSSPQTKIHIKSIKILSPQNNTALRFNDVLKIAYQTAQEYPADSIRVFLNGKELKYTRLEPDKIQIKIPEYKTGKLILKLHAYHKGGKESSSSCSLNILPDTKPIRLNYTIIKEYPHDKKAYTQGLVYHEDFIYEGTGLREGLSSLRKLDIKTGKVISILNLDKEYFGEGITIYKNRIYQLTWTSRKGFIYEIENFSPISTFGYPTEGWGLTTMDKELVMSDGSNSLHFIEPESFFIKRSIQVFDYEGPVNSINELEYANGLIWANIWLKDKIIAIDPYSGAVVKEIDFSSLLTKKERKKMDIQDDVLNGIAYNYKKKTFYITGKRWPKLFEIDIIQKDTEK